MHRGLGVHISFVRSVNMDAFKPGELARMDAGGNDAWKAFFDSHQANVAEGRTFDDATIQERYGGDVGQEYKERLTAKVEGREYVPVSKAKAKTGASASPIPRTGTPTSGTRSSRSHSPSAISGGAPLSKKEQNEAYFARMGAANSARPDNLPPSHGGKYGGFGGGMPVSPPARDSGTSAPGIDEFQADPVAALTKGFGWFTSTLGRSARSVNDSVLQPAAKTVRSPVYPECG